MFVKPFRYERAESLAHACELLRAADGGAKAIAGGQSLLPMMNLGLLDLEAVVDVGHVEGAGGVRADDGYVVLGALTRHRDLERDPVVAARQPLLAEAVRWVGSPRIRTRGTLGGSLAHSDPAAELPLAMIALGAEYTLTDGRAERVVRADEFHVTYFTSALADDELVASVRVPALGPGWGWGFAEVARRRGDFALAAAAALARVADGRVVEARLALGGVGERAMRMGAIEAAATGAGVEELPDRIGPVEGIAPVTDTSASAEHRRHLSRVLAGRALADAVRRGGEAA
ncbi:MAG: FAD binding domain-containing protein [Actinomycetota bacterium]